MAGETEADGADPARWRKVKATRVADLGMPPDTATDILGEAADSLAEAPPESVIEDLARADRPVEAVRLLAFALPKREAVWWACLAARHAMGLVAGLAAPADVPAGSSDCLEAAEAWVYKPVEERRIACYRAAQGVRADSPAALAALAAAWSGGTLVPPEVTAEVQAVPPEESLTASVVGHAVVLSAVMRDPVTAPERYRRYLAQGRDIARGGTGALEDGATGPPAPGR
ncbi:DUF6931 family protein [Roseospira navarrensis]|uniref:Uncharacterized protein n=1 Tax=Roseospira navarrensis TaxID=140058 RepID=A0A7X1ZE66_9PROT|nr:hypothetical protein [Roseospira navarrensis]MQX35941.1 hypothetical protein [Roseospira navarrensis]